MNNQISLPFQPQFKEDMRAGRKIFTTRTKRHGYPGDWFVAFGMYFVLTHVSKTQLKIVAEGYYSQEGFSSPEGFIEIWERLHPIHIHEFNDSPTCCICGFQKCEGENE